MTLAPETARQYLKAMGIESWELRGAEPVGQSVNQPVNQPVPQVDALTQPRSNIPAGLLPAGQTDATTFIGSLAVAPVRVTAQQPSRLLVLLETPVLTQAGTDLLSSMLKAIEIDLASQTVGYLAASGEAGTEVQALAGTTEAAVILVMADLQGDIQNLATHRSILHSVGWAGAPVAITLHPNVLLKTPAYKRDAWEDLKRVKATLNG